MQKSIPQGCQVSAEAHLHRRHLAQLPGQLAPGWGQGLAVPAVGAASHVSVRAGCQWMCPQHALGTGLPVHLQKDVCAVVQDLHPGSLGVGRGPMQAGRSSLASQGSQDCQTSCPLPRAHRPHGPALAAPRCAGLAPVCHQPRLQWHATPSCQPGMAHSMQSHCHHCRTTSSSPVRTLSKLLQRLRAERLLHQIPLLTHHPEHLGFSTTACESTNSQLACHCKPLAAAMLAAESMQKLGLAGGRAWGSLLCISAPKNWATELKVSLLLATVTNTRRPLNCTCRLPMSVSRACR